MIASLIGGLSLVAVLMVSCNGGKLRWMLRYLSRAFGVATFFQFLTLVLFGTLYCDPTDNCIVGVGAVASITGGFFWLFCAAASASIPFYPSNNSAVAAVNGGAANAEPTQSA